MQEWTAVFLCRVLLFSSRSTLPFFFFPTRSLFATCVTLNSPLVVSILDRRIFFLPLIKIYISPSTLRAAFIFSLDVLRSAGGNGGELRVSFLLQRRKNINRTEILTCYASAPPPLFSRRKIKSAYFVPPLSPPPNSTLRAGALLSFFFFFILRPLALVFSLWRRRYIALSSAFFFP